MKKDMNSSEPSKEHSILISMTSPAFSPISILSPTVNGDLHKINIHAVIFVIGSRNAIAIPADKRPK